MRPTHTCTAGLVALSLAALAACTPTTADMTQPSPSASASPSPSPSPTPERVPTAELRLPDGPATVAQAADGPTRALATSQTFYASAPVAVVAPADDVAAQVRAAAVAVALGAPLLLTVAHVPVAEGGPDPAVAEGADPTADELERLGALTVVTVGTVELGDTDLAVVEAPRDDDALSALLGVELEPAPLPATGAELATVMAFDRTAPTLPTGTATAPATTDPAPTEQAGTLPLTERAEALAGALLLTTGDPADLASVATARAAGAAVVTVPTGDPRATTATVQALAGAGATHVLGLGAAFGDAETLAWTSATAATGVELPGGGQLVLAGRRFVAMYGTPTYPALGLLGEQDLAGSIGRAQGLAAAYQPMTTDVVVPAFEIIVTIASGGAGADGNYSNELPVETFVPWVEAAAAAGVYVVLDLQPGRTDFLTQAQMYEPLLRYPNVGLALDPEWRLLPDQVHLRQIGSVGVDEVNAVAAYLAQLTRTNALPQKLFVLHQFKASMVQGRERVDMSHPELAVMVHVDGQGGQPAKTGTWNALHEGAPAGVAWGWKNFIDEDVPMLTPEQTYAIQPPPQLVSYQ